MEKLAFDLMLYSFGKSAVAFHAINPMCKTKYANDSLLKEIRKNYPFQCNRALNILFQRKKN